MIEYNVIEQGVVASASPSVYFIVAVPLVFMCVVVALFFREWKNHEEEQGNE